MHTTSVILSHAATPRSPSDIETGQGKPKDQAAALEQEVSEISDRQRSRFWEADPDFKNFRSHPAGTTENGAPAPIRVSGSSQPSVSALEYLALKAGVGIDVDLREEEHGYVKNPGADSAAGQDPYISVSFTNHGNWPNPGIKSGNLMKHESRLFKKAARKKEMEIILEAISKIGIPTSRKVVRMPAGAARTKIQASLAETEQQAIDKLNKLNGPQGLPTMEYFRVPITDELPPEPRDIDDLVAIYRHALATEKNIHFHCEMGRGRTTTAMVLTGIMDGKSVEEAIATESNQNPELNGQGKDIREIKASELLEPVLVKATALRLGMMHRFYDYWNSSSRDTMSFKKYMKAHPMDRKFMLSMIAKLIVIPDKSIAG